MIPLGTISTETLEFLERCVLARAEHPDLRRYRLRQDDAPERAVRAPIPDNERIVTIEDAAELRLNQRHVLRLESRPKNIEGEGEIAIRELVRNSLRMRPDRIIVGEVRGAGDARHAPGDEHRPRRLALDRPRELARATRSPASRRWC